jgi:hypothetical protein
MDRFAENMKKIENMEKNNLHDHNDIELETNNPVTTTFESSTKQISFPPKKKRKMIQAPVVEVSSIPPSWKSENLSSMFSKYGNIIEIQKKERETTA